jgi:hypothetical protein
MRTCIAPNTFADPYFEMEEEFSFQDFPHSILEALGNGLEGVAIKLAAAFGDRDENRLTNLVFFARHPERSGGKLVKGEPGYDQLSAEWLDIRDNLVRPAMKRYQPPSIQPTRPKFGSPCASNGESDPGKIRRLASLVEKSGIDGFATFAVAAAYTESRWKNLSANCVPSEAKAACKLFAGAKSRGYYGGNAFPRERWCFGSGGWFGLLPATGLAAGGAKGPFAHADPFLVFDPASSVVMLADFVVRLVRRYGAQNWLAVRRGMASVNLIGDINETKPRSKDVRARFADALKKSGVDPASMYEKPVVDNYPGARSLLKLLQVSKL